VRERERFFSSVVEAKEGEGAEIGLDNRQIQSLNGDVYLHLNTLGLRYPVVRPSDDLVKPSGFVVPSPDRCKVYPFYISRTKSYNLPVYIDLKKSGRCLTILRRIAGSMDEIETELQKFIPRERIIRKEGHFKIKGHYSKVLRGWLYGLGF